jgi:D-amino-acid dehydrogenase
MADDPVVVVGAGLVGLACAHYLAAAGLQPLVIDEKEPGAGASWGNAGWIVFAPPVLAPVPGPGIVGTSLRWLFKRHSPLRLLPRFEWDYVRWLVRFMASCSADKAASGLKATVELNEQTDELFESLRAEGHDFEMHHDGALLVYETRKGFDEAKELFVDGGVPLAREEALEAEPLLEPASVAGAIRYDRDRHVRPDSLIAALVASLEEKGVEVRSGTRCLGLERNGGVGVRTPGGTIASSAVVLAAGTGIARLTRVPIQAGRGYSFDVPQEELPIRAPIHVHEGRIALTPFREFTRVVGLMELGARSAKVRPAAVETMHRVGEATFRSWPAKQAGTAWAGLRPMTPDGLPVIGPVAENVYVAGGHGMLGVTLSLRTGKAIADCIRDGGCTDPLLQPFSPRRFG